MYGCNKARYAPPYPAPRDIVYAVLEHYTSACSIARVCTDRKGLVKCMPAFSPKAKNPGLTNQIVVPPSHDSF